MHQEHKQRLLAKRAELARRAEALQRDASQPLERDSEEQAVQLENSEVESEFQAEAMHQIDEIDAALAQIARGTYGTCAVCGAAIAGERLNAYPAAVRCVTCAEAAK